MRFLLSATLILSAASIANAQTDLIRTEENSSKLHLTVNHQGILDSIALIEVHLGRPIASGVVNVFELYDSLTVTNNLVDQDNDGLTRATDCDDYDFLTGAAPTWYQDEDGDAAGDPNETLAACEQPTGYVAIAGDGCPTDASKTTAGVCGCGAAEVDVDSDGVCDTNDDCTDTTACNYTANPTESCTYASTWYADTDGDGYGDPLNTQSSCAQPPGYVAGAGDDCPSDVNKTEPGLCGCNAVDTDTDADGLCDFNDSCTDTAACNYDADPTEACTYGGTWYADNDGDGLGDAGNSTTACEMPAGYVSNNSDADDGYPGAVGTLSVLSGNSFSGFSVTFAVDQPINTENFDITIANSNNNNTSFYHSYGLGAYNVAVGAVPTTEGTHTLTWSTVNTSGEALFPNVTVNVQCECDMGPGDKDMCDSFWYGNWACTKQ